ncbi:hypothetical protein D3C75_905390 [compost metagenome]
MHALVHVAAVVAVGPTIETAVLHGSDVVRYQIATDLVTLVDCRPQRAAVWLPGQAVRVAQAGGEQAVLAAGGVHFPDRGAPLFLVHTVFAYVAVGADRHEKFLAIGAGDDVLGPVVVERPAWQLDYRLAFIANLHGTGLVVKAQQPVGVGDVEVLADQGHAER